jgi:hypothetical protein
MMQANSTTRGGAPRLSPDSSAFHSCRFGPRQAVSYRVFISCLSDTFFITMTDFPRCWESFIKPPFLFFFHPVTTYSDFVSAAVFNLPLPSGRSLT